MGGGPLPGCALVATASRPDLPVEPSTISDPNIVDCFVAEVLSGMPGELRRFLVHTSIRDRFCAPPGRTPGIPLPDDQAVGTCERYAAAPTSPLRAMASLGTSAMA